MYHFYRNRCYLSLFETYNSYKVNKLVPRVMPAMLKTNFIDQRMF